MKKKFGEVLRQIRHEKGLTQEKTAFSSGLGYRFYQDLERGVKQPTITTLFKLSKALEVPPNSLIEPAWQWWPENSKNGIS